MNTAFDQMREAIANARDIERAAAQNAETMAELITGNLRRVSGSQLCKLKRELRLFNISTRKWRQAK